MLRSLLRLFSNPDAEIDAILQRGAGALSVEDHNRVYQAGCDLISPFMILHIRPSRSARTSQGQQQVRRGIRLLTFITQANPGNWNAHWIIGKGYQAIGDSVAACDSFHAAFALHQDNPDVAREFMFECLNIGRIDEAVAAARHAVSLQPEDAGLLGNLGLALLVAADLDEAERVIEQALALDPNDTITRNVADVVRAVRSGERSQPRRLTDLN